jgi:nucleotide-binding universal stress UspA family protein
MNMSTLKTILLCTDGSPAASGAVEGALWLARQLQARVRILHVTDIRLLEGPMLADLSGAMGAQPYTALLPQLRQIQKDKADVILGTAAKRCRDVGVECEVSHETGSLVHTMLQHEADADLVVLGQRGEHAQWLGDMLGSSVERMVRASVKPCLVVPPQFRKVTHMLLAYDGSDESAKALRFGLDLAAALGVKVTIVTACQRDQEESASRVLQQAHELARGRKVPAEAQLVHGDAETEILRLTDKTKADLVVMGAYGHTRIRELILGSTTSHVIRKADVPVLLARGK